MKQHRTVLDEQDVLGVWQIFSGCVFQKVVQNGGFVKRGEKTSGVPRLVAHSPNSISCVLPSHFDSET